MRMFYFDNNATTPLDPRVLEAMLPFFTEHFGNAESSQHAFGWKAKLALDRARAQVAELLGAKPQQIIFTSGATESMNLAIFGIFDSIDKAPRHIISSVAEHKATLEICKRLAEFGHDVTLLPVNRYGQVTPEQVRAALRPNTSLVTLMHANNEIGSLNPIAEIGSDLRQRRILFHVDAAQTVGKELIDVQSMAIDLLSLSAHKFYGPKGTGALYLRRPEVNLAPFLIGGGQEQGLRSGTHNIPGIVGLGMACEIAKAEMRDENLRLRAFRDQIISALATHRIELNGHPSERVSNNVHLTALEIGLDQLLAGLSEVAFSTTSACSTGSFSHVLQAIGRDSTDPKASSMRFGLGRFTTQAEVDRLIALILQMIEKS